MEGFHVPLIPFIDAGGNTGTGLPAQADNAAPKLNVGVIIGLTVTINVVERAQIPALGVNV